MQVLVDGNHFAGKSVVCDHLRHLLESEGRSVRMSHGQVTDNQAVHELGSLAIQTMNPASVRTGTDPVRDFCLLRAAQLLFEAVCCTYDYSSDFQIHDRHWFSHYALLLYLYPNERTTWDAWRERVRLKSELCIYLTCSPTERRWRSETPRPYKKSNVLGNFFAVNLPLLEAVEQFGLKLIDEEDELWMVIENNAAPNVTAQQIATLIKKRENKVAL